MINMNIRLKMPALLILVAIFAALLQFGSLAGNTLQTSTERFNMTYIYFGNTAAYTGYVDDTKGSLDHISPSYFDLNKDGSLKLTGAIDRDFIDAMHDRGIKVTPFLSNHWDKESGVNALNNAELLSSQIVDAISKYDLDGVNVDIENMGEKERDQYTDFVRMLRNKLPSGKIVSVAVAANPYKISKGWHASYDLAALQQHSDYIMLMAYDQHYQGYVNATGGAGPVAGYGFVEESIKEALKEVPANKLVLGIAFYGRLWKQGADYGGYGVSNNTVEALVREFNGKVIFDNTHRSPKAVITIKANDRKPVIFGKQLEQGTYDFWFENEASIKRKLELVGKYDLLGTGSWSLGQETKSTWDYYSLWLDGRYFSDIQNHWAKASIITAMDKGWMNGVSSTRFMPDSPMTRAQAAALLVRALDIGVTAATEGKAVFSDVTGHWAREEIEAAAKAGILQGVGSGRFEPDAVLTREQMAVLLDRLLGDAGADSDTADGNGTGSETASTVFPDVDPAVSTWSYEAIGRMTAQGFIEGFPDGTFRPKDTIRRGQMAVLMERTYPELAGSEALAAMR
ncbi:MAG: glycoside hydrolase [Clostridiaceae bacterium]|nr:glycoside hydrolase [Clostridiaceae bacterium]